MTGITALTLTSAAAKMVKEEVRRSSIADPVVHLMLRGELRFGNPEVARAVLEGKDDEALRELMLKHHGTELKNSPRILCAIVHPRDHLPAEALIEASGIMFCFPPHILKRMAGWQLDIERETLVLRDENGTAVMPPYEADS